LQSAPVHDALYSPLRPAPSAVRPGLAGTGSGPATLSPFPTSLVAPVQLIEKSAFLVPSQASDSVLYNQFANVLITPQSLSSVQAIADNSADPAAGNDARPNGKGNNGDAVVVSGGYNAVDDSGQDRSESASKPEPARYSQQQDSESGQSEGIASDTDAGEAYTALDERQLQEVRKLAAIDREVRAHEQAHVAVGGQHAGAPQYSYKKGPDGIDYAVGGEVPIDVSVVPGRPEATIAKMEQVRRAALAPAQPSSQDRAVAAQATQTILQARSEMAQAASQPTLNQGGESEQTDAGGDNTDLPSDKNYLLKRGLQAYAGLATMANDAISGADTTYVLDVVI